uniref:Peptidase n=1 Tax=viral metagenome TaxID=1070528 RepID=A0A6M3Y334_9ZZZZ
MLIKAGVDISRLRPEIRRKLRKIAQTVWACDNQELVITSTYEGNHNESSLHYVNLAIDIRRDQAMSYSFKELKRTLGADYDVVQEANHIHIEYDPKP